MLIRLIFLAGFAFVLAYAFLFGMLLVKERAVAEPGHSQAMIVLGAQVNPDGQPSRQLALRLEAALDAYQKSPMPIVVTGAQGLNEPATEASVMRDWLTARGVPAQQVLMDESSTNTRQNIAHAAALLPQGTRNVLLITSDYHLPRAMAIARDLGLSPSGIGSPILPEYWLKNHARETLAWGKYYVNKFLPMVPDD